LKSWAAPRTAAKHSLGAASIRLVWTWRSALTQALPEIRILFLSCVPAGPLSFRRSRSVWRRIDHLSDPSQSPRLHDRYRQKPPQGQCKSIMASSFVQKFRGGFCLCFTCTLSHSSRTNSAFTLSLSGTTAQESKPTKREQIVPSWGGGKRNVQEKTFLSNCSRIVGEPTHIVSPWWG